jgi:hypothetical protein
MTSLFPPFPPVKKMSPDHDKLIKEIFADALEKADGAERAAYLAQACNDDLRRRGRFSLSRPTGEGRGEGTSLPRNTPWRPTP